MFKIIGYLLLYLSCSYSHAAIITVDRADDLNIAGDSGCDLREAINSANLNISIEDCMAGDDETIDIILINVNQSIQLQFEIEVIGSALITRHSSVPIVEILAGTDQRHFTLNLTESEDQDFAMVGLHLKNGRSNENGGSVLIQKAGRLEITDCVFENNEAVSGGAIYASVSNASEFQLLKNQFINNRAIDIKNSNSLGGAIYGNNTINGVFEITNNLFQENSANNGGAIFLSESNDIIAINKNRFYSNQADRFGGALFLSELVAGQFYNLEQNIFLYNMAGNLGGAIHGKGFGDLTIAVVNSTFGMNQANQGGAIATDAGNIQVYASTLAYNAALSGGAQVAEINAGIISFTKSILAHGQQQDNCAGSILSNADNIDDDGSCAFAAANGNIVADPLLSGLREFNNPDPNLPIFLPGFQLSADSPALDYEDDDFCWIPPGNDLMQDQHGLSRDIDGDGDGNVSCDLGAIEAPTDNDLIYDDSFGV